MKKYTQQEGMGLFREFYEIMSKQSTGDGSVLRMLTGYKKTKPVRATAKPKHGPRNRWGGLK